jgi:hypothetical protein
LASWVTPELWAQTHGWVVPRLALSVMYCIPNAQNSSFQIKQNRSVWVIRVFVFFAWVLYFCAAPLDLYCHLPLVAVVCSVWLVHHALGDTWRCAFIYDDDSDLGEALTTAALCIAYSAMSLFPESLDIAKELALRVGFDVGVELNAVAYAIFWFICECGVSKRLNAYLSFISRGLKNVFHGGDTNSRLSIVWRKLTDCFGWMSGKWWVPAAVWYWGEVLELCWVIAPLGYDLVLAAKACAYKFCLAHYDIARHYLVMLACYSFIWAYRRIRASADAKITVGLPDASNHHGAPAKLTETKTDK